MRLSDLSAKNITPEPRYLALSRIMKSHRELVVDEGRLMGILADLDLQSVALYLNACLWGSTRGPR